MRVFRSPVFAATTVAMLGGFQRRRGVPCAAAKWAGLLSLLCIFLALGGCKKKSTIAKHPAQKMVSRNVERVKLLDLIVVDPKRAEAADEILREIWSLGREFNLLRNREFERVLGRAETGGAEQESTQHLPTELAMRRVAEGSGEFWDRYRDLMLQLRSILTCKEYGELLASNGYQLKEGECSGQR